VSRIEHDPQSCIVSYACALFREIYGAAVNEVRIRRSIKPIWQRLYLYNKISYTSPFSFLLLVSLHIYKNQSTNCLKYTWDTETRHWSSEKPVFDAEFILKAIMVIDFALIIDNSPYRILVGTCTSFKNHLSCALFPVLSFTICSPSLIYLRLYIPLLNLGSFSASWAFTQSVGLLGRGISPSQSRCLHTRRYTLTQTIFVFSITQRHEAQQRKHRSSIVARIHLCGNALIQLFHDNGCTRHISYRDTSCVVACEHYLATAISLSPQFLLSANTPQYVTTNNYDTLTNLDTLQTTAAHIKSYVRYSVVINLCWVAAPSNGNFLRASKNCHCSFATHDWLTADSDLRITFPVGPRYIALARTIQKTRLPTIPLLLRVESLLRKSVYRSVV
jgi:hypothetical protein